MAAVRSLRGRLNRLAVSASGVALLTAMLGFALYEVTSFRDELEGHVSILAQVIGVNSTAALQFFDPGAAREALEPLQGDPSLRFGCLYTSDGVSFAHYAASRPADFRCPELRPDGSGFSADRLTIVRPIRHAGEEIGWIHLEASTAQLQARLWSYAGIAVVVLGVSFALTLPLSWRLQRVISGPIRDLVNGTRAMADGDLSVSVRVEGTDELASLGGAFEATAGSLRDLIGRVRTSTLAVAEAMRTLQDSSEGIAAHADSQQSAVSETRESMERIGDSIRELATSSEELEKESIETANAVHQMDSGTALVATRMDDLAGTIEGTASSISELSASIQEIAQSLATLETATGGTSASIDAMRNSVDTVQRSAAESQNVSQDTADAARSGVDKVTKTVQGMDEIRDRFGEIEGVVGELSEQSQAIDEIVQVIDQVAEQTGLLSLNAEIIASQAGEHGKAFSVVAHEVKELSERTTTSAREIGRRIAGVVAKTTQVVEAVSRGSITVREGVERSREAGEVLRRIGESSEHTSRVTGEISEVTALQVTSMRQVDEEVGRIREMVATIGRAIREQERSAAGIAQAAEQIQEVGTEVKRSTTEQRSASRHLTRAVEVVEERIQLIRAATMSHACESQRIAERVVLFEETAESSLQRAGGLRDVVEQLSALSADLASQVERFRL